MAEGTFLVANIRGFVSLTSDKGPAAAARLEAAFADIMRQGIEPHAGTLISRRAGEATVLFDSPFEAVRTAVELQDRFRKESDSASSLPLRVGIGIAAGSYATTPDTYVSVALKVAESLCALAGHGETLTSEAVALSVGELPDLTISYRGAVEFGGFREPMKVFQVASLAQAMDEASQK